MLYETHFLIALCVTCLVEVPLLFFLIRYILKEKDLSVVRIISTGLLATAVTLPYLWFVLPAFTNGVYYPLVGELLVIAAEATIFYFLLRVRPIAAFFLSLVINMSSFAAGILIG
ncbi:MAG TPA: hypothetical protein VHN82_00845 [Methanoregula sp.]|nr:hypothetical protein [Methanoregula sp.]